MITRFNLPEVNKYYHFLLSKNHRHQYFFFLSRETNLVVKKKKLKYMPKELRNLTPLNKLPRRYFSS